MLRISRNSKRELLESKAFIACALIPFIFPDSFNYCSQLSSISSIVYYWKIAATVILLFSVVSKARSVRYPASAMIVIFLCLLLCFCTLFNNASTDKLISALLKIIAAFLLVIACRRDNYKALSQVGYGILSVECIICGAMCIAWPDGVPYADLYFNKENPMNFLSSDNGVSEYLLLWQMFSIIKIQNNRKLGLKRVRTVAVPIVICILIELITQSISGLIAVSLMSIVGICLLVKVSKSSIKKSLYIFLVLYLIFTLLVIVIPTSGVSFEWMTAILGRTATFTGRVSLWSSSIQLILLSPLFGYGFSFGGGFLSVWGGYFSSHNAFLEVCIIGGIPALVTYVALFVVAYRNILKGDYSVEMTAAIGSALACFLLVMSMETIQFQFALWIPLLMGALGLQDKSKTEDDIRLGLRRQ